MENRKKLKLIILTYDSLYSNPIFLPLLNKNWIDIKAVISSSCILYKKTRLQSLAFLLYRQGLQYFAFKAFDQLWYSAIAFFQHGNIQGRFIKEAKKRTIPVITTKDVNDEKMLNMIRKYEPDVILSYFNQIL